MKLEFSWQIFSENTQLSNFMKIRPVGADADKRTDRHDEANCRFSQFCERPEKNAFVFTEIIYKTGPGVWRNSQYSPYDRYVHTLCTEILSFGCISVSCFHDFKYVEGYIKYHLLFIAYRRELYPVLLGIINCN
jgi:hypothetical protein